MKKQADRHTNRGRGWQVRLGGGGGGGGGGGVGGGGGGGGGEVAKTSIQRTINTS